MALWFIKCLANPSLFKILPSLRELEDQHLRLGEEVNISPEARIAVQFNDILWSKVKAIFFT